jgi:hypothetical protein
VVGVGWCGGAEVGRACGAADAAGGRVRTFFAVGCDDESCGVSKDESLKLGAWALCYVNATTRLGMLTNQNSVAQFQPS